MFYNAWHQASHQSSNKHCRVHFLFRPVTIGVREGILLGERKKFALKITICPKNKQYAPKLTFYLIQIGPETPCKAVLYSWIRL